MRVLSKRRLIADHELARTPRDEKPGQQWHEASVLRFLPKSDRRGSMIIYVRPEHRDVLDSSTAACPSSRSSSAATACASPR
jgi:hypothetical protein